MHDISVTIMISADITFKVSSTIAKDITTKITEMPTQGDEAFSLAKDEGFFRLIPY